MNTSNRFRNLQRQSMVTSSPNTPLLRRSVLNSSVHSPAIANRQPVNDDEAERRSSRIIDTVESSESISNLAEAADSLNNCLKLFAENKICKENAWTLNIIDSFSKLIKKHHHSLSNFQVAGSTLEASAKVYSLRVDSVYTDVLRMSADLSRQTAKALTKKNHLNADNDDESERENDERDKENLNSTNQPTQDDPTKKQKKKRKNVSTITKNPDTINARLDTYPLVDPFFAKLNSMVGDINSSKRLMQNIIPTVDSNLQLQHNAPIWNSEDIDLPLEPEGNYADLSKRNLILTVTSVTTSAANAQIRSGLKNYRICDAPMENAEEAEISPNELNETTTRNNMSHVELQFDINAEVEPIPTERSFVMDFGDMNDDDFGDVDDAAMIAVNRCKGLKRQPVMIEDMQPETAVHLEYSYRPLDNIDQLWAGPSHWKFRQSRRTHASVGGRASQATTTEEVHTAKQRPKAVRKKKLIKKTEACLEDFHFLEENDAVMKVNKKVKGTQISTQSMTKRWDHKKLKLPVDHKLPADLFDSFTHATSLYINSNPDATFTGNDEGVPYDYENENDRNYCSRIADAQSDTETETNTDMGQMDNNLEFDHVEMPPPGDNIDEIPDFYLGAPERVEKIQIAFAKRAKNIDMKQLKLCSWNLISKKRTTDPLHNPCFSDTLHELPKVLSKTMAENMSMPLAFYAILHLCNDKGLVLSPNGSLRDFDIGFVDTLEI